ncbi:MAG: hypothetical protein OEM49_02360 [Myxococcales bacterium]|nr:hypothetical protein [Myxococcales bacterium]MDH5306701.1 hypothetical protein [Myxococcales bacterium]MDH5565413.1 hypothetical protein [Myxococcales bacterium]
MNTRCVSIRFLLGCCALAGSLLWSDPARAQSGAAFDHSTTRFPLTGSHRREPCESCHAEGLFAGTPDRCELCHDGSGLRAQTEKTRDHVSSSNRCDDCHDTVIWSRAVFDHSGVEGRCATCHDGMQATGKPLDHILTNGDCGSCHSTLAWTPASFDHANITGTCAGCHDGVTATGIDTGHFVTTSDCGACHDTRRWSPSTFRHASAGYSGDHRRALDCTACHTTNRDSVPWPSPGYAPDCAACHATDFKPDAHKKVDSPPILYTVAELKDCTGACHEYTDSSFSTIRQTRSGEHRVSAAEF